MNLSPPQFERLRVLSSVVLGAALLLCLAATVLDTGAWRWTEEIHGPFHPEQANSATYVVPFGIKGRSRFIFSEASDGAGTSDLRLWLNGEEWGPGHTPHAAIRAGNTRGFSHWNELVYISLPPSIPNDEAVILRATYSARLRPALTLVLALATVGLLVLHLTAFGLPRVIVHLMRRLAPLLLIAFPVVSWLAIAVSVFYLATVLYGCFSGYALPTAALFDLIPATRSLVIVEPYIPIAIIIVAALGAAVNWLAHFSILPALTARQVEMVQFRLWGRFGLLVIVALTLFALSSVGWSGRIRSNDVNYFSFAGLVPNSDASSYFTATSDQIQIGSWNESASRRPFSQAFRDLIAFTVRYSYVGMLIVQTLLVSLMLFLAAARIASWRGIWAAIAFTALGLLIARPFLFMPLSEPLGMVWALLCVVFLVEAIRRRSVAHALVALLVLTVALWTRMGAMLVIPSIVLWLSFMFATKVAVRLRLMAIAACAILAVVAVNSLLALFYGEARTLSGGNFTYTLCGLSVGGVWSTCAERYAANLHSLDATDQATFLIRTTWQNVLQQPAVIVAMLVRNASRFVFDSPRFFLLGASDQEAQTPLMIQFAAMLLLPGIIFALRWRSSRIERSFWVALWLGVIASAAFIFADAGWRNMHVTHVLLALFFSLGFAVPGGIVTRARNSWMVRPRTGVAFVATAAAFFVAVPALARLVDRIELPPGVAPPHPNVDFVAGGHWPTGFLVIADDAPRPISVPSLPYSEFARMIEISNLETEAGPFLHNAAARLPFAFMTSPDIDQRNATAHYIAPPLVLSRPDVRVWRFTVTYIRPDNIVRFVEQAVPVVARE